MKKCYQHLKILNLIQKKKRKEIKQMIRAKNIQCFLRSIDKREAGSMVSEGQTIKWDSGYKLELDIFDPEEEEQKNKLRTCTLSLADNSTNANYYEKLRYIVPMTPFKADINIIITKSGLLKINLDKIHLESIGGEQKTK